MSRFAPRQLQDPAGFGRVGLVAGGDSAERDVSLDGGRAIEAALRREGVDVTQYDGPAPLFDAIREGRVDRVFNILHGPGGEDGALQGALRLMGVPVTGTGMAGSALTMDKVRSKWLWERLDIPTPPFALLGPDDGPEQVVGFEYPLFVKPNGQGSSIGISKVADEDGLADALALARRYGDQVIVEPGIEGGEYFAGVLDGVALPLIRIETPREFYDYEAKYESDETRYFCPCGLPEALESRLQALSLRAFEALGGAGWGRVDFLLDADQQPWFLEANTTPGMTDHSLVPQAAAQAGIGFDELVWRILETSL